MKLFKLMLPILFASTIMISPTESQAESQESSLNKMISSENVTYLIKNPSQSEEIVRLIESKYPELKTTVVEEIGLISLDPPENESYTNQIEELNKYLDHLVDVQGELPKLTLTPEPDISQDVLMEAAEKERGSQIQPSGFMNRPSIPELTSPYFLPFNWYLGDITDQYQSQLIDKGDRATIALIDSGVDINHPLLKDHIDITHARNYVTNEQHVTDEFGHGTQIAGILTSIAPNSTIVPYKVLGAVDGESVWLIEAIIDAANNKSDVINISLGSYKTKSIKDDKLIMKAYEEAVRYAKKKGSIVVASAGNNAYDLNELKKNKEFHLPGGLHHIITVSSNTREHHLASYSNFGKEVDFSAPGGDLSFANDGMLDITQLAITTYPNDRPNTMIDQIIGIPQGYTLSMGTSLSAPQVSATAALIISEHKEQTGKKPTVNEVIKYLKEGSLDIGEKGKDNYFGEGKINAYQSLLSVK
jgi:lantibiotic leader peptide-processing serine protease